MAKKATAPKKEKPTKQLNMKAKGKSKKQCDINSCGCGPMETKTNSKSTLKNEKMDKKSMEKSKTGTTKIIIKYNCGFPNNLFIRGEGMPGLSWDRGIAMKNVKADEWLWETDKCFEKIQFKIILNDRVYEQGPNHAIECSKTGVFSPKF